MAIQVFEECCRSYFIAFFVRRLPTDQRVPGVEQIFNSSTEVPAELPGIIRLAPTSFQLIGVTQSQFKSRESLVDIGMNQCLGETLHQFQAVNEISGQEELMAK